MTDTARFLELQADYKAGHAEAMGAMYELLFTLAYKAVNKAANANKSVRGLAPAERQKRAHDAATYVIEQYLKRPDFLIENVTGYLYPRVQKELFYARKCDKMLVYTGTLPEKPATRKAYHYIVTDTRTGAKTTYASAGEMYLNPVFHGLRKKRLVDCVRNGTVWKNYVFEVIEI